MTPLLSSVRLVWKKLLEKSKVLRTGLPARCMNKPSMWPRVATSGLVAELVGLRSKHSRYLEEIGVGIDFLSNMLSNNVCSIAFSAGGAYFLMRTMLVAQSVTVFVTVLYFLQIVDQLLRCFSSVGGPESLFGTWW